MQHKLNVGDSVKIKRGNNKDRTGKVKFISNLTDRVHVLLDGKPGPSGSVFFYSPSSVEKVED